MWRRFKETKIICSVITLETNGLFQNYLVPHWEHCASYEATLRPDTTQVRRLPCQVPVTSLRPNPITARIDKHKTLPHYDLSSWNFGVIISIRIIYLSHQTQHPPSHPPAVTSLSRGQLKCDDTCAETRFRLSAKRTSPFKSAGGVSSVDYWQPRCAHQR